MGDPVQYTVVQYSTFSAVLSVQCSTVYCITIILYSIYIYSIYIPYRVLTYCTWTSHPASYPSPVLTLQTTHKDQPRMCGVCCQGSSLSDFLATKTISNGQPPICSISNQGNYLSDFMPSKLSTRAGHQWPKVSFFKVNVQEILHRNYEALHRE